MKIVASDLRMDASTGCREVREQAGGGRGKSRILIGNEPACQLRLPPLATGMKEMNSHVVRCSTKVRSLVRTAADSESSCSTR